MTALAELPIASGSTLQPLPVPNLPSLRTAEEYAWRDPRDIRQVTISVQEHGRWTRGPWFVRHIERELNRLLSLPPGWSGRREHRITLAAIEAVVGLLSQAMDTRSALPQFFPLPDGGIQIEWHAGGDDVEVEIDGAGEAHVLATAADGTTVVEGLLKGEGSRERSERLHTFVRDLSKRAPFNR